MEEVKIKKVRVKRIKEEPKEPKIKKVRVKRIKEEVETLEQIRKVRIIHFKKEYEHFIELGAAPDEYIENLVNKIALLYFYAKNVDIDSKILKAKLKEIDYKKFMKLYTDISVGKMRAMGIFRKMHNGAILLINLLTILKIDMDEKIKLPMNLVQFRYEIEQKRVNKASNKADYKFISLKRMFVIKDNQIIETGHIIEPNKKFKGSTIMIEHDKGQFISLPYRYYEKLYEIDSMDFSYYIIENKPAEGFAKGSIDEYDDLDIEEICDKDENIIYYTAGLTAPTFEIVITSILYYESLWQSIDEYNSITYSGCFCARESITLTFKNGDVKTYYNYDKFIQEYFPFLRL